MILGQLRMGARQAKNAPLYIYRHQKCQQSPIGGENSENCLIKKFARTKTKLFLDSIGQKLFIKVEKC